MTAFNRYAILLLTLVFTTGNLHAKAVGLIKGAKELAKYLTKKGGDTAAKELVEIGGEKAVKDVLEKCAKEGGEELTKEVISNSKTYGPSFIRAIKPDPLLFSKSFKNVPKKHSKAAILELNSNPILMKKLIQSHGDEALEVAAMHPGVGAKVISKYGNAGVKAGKQLTTPDVITLSRVQGFDDLPQASKSKFLKILDAKPKQVINALTIAGGGVAIILTTAKVNEIVKIATGTLEAPGELVTVATKFTWGIAILLTLALAVWLLIHLRKSWKISNKKIQRV